LYKNTEEQISDQVSEGMNTRNTSVSLREGVISNILELTKKNILYDFNHALPGIANVFVLT
jgi:FKBP-type peptidyl-prolyl cis-trans isomerase 2